MIPPSKIKMKWGFVPGTKIGFFGRMGSGKTEMANLFDYEKVSFADKLKEDVIHFGLTLDGLIDKARDRTLLQNYGQLRRGEIPLLISNKKKLENWEGYLYYRTGGECKLIGVSHPGYWINLTRKAIKNKNDVIIDDIRRYNEASMLKELGFTIIKVVVDESIRLERLKRRDGDFDPTTFANISETETDTIPYDALLDNSGTIEESKEKLFGILNAVTHF